MTTEATSSRAAVSARPPEPDWTDQVTDLVVDLVDSARDKTTGPVLTASRGVVYGVVILIVAGVLGIIGVALTGRLISLLPIAEWLSYAILGTILVACGLVCWTKREPS